MGGKRIPKLNKSQLPCICVTASPPFPLWVTLLEAFTTLITHSIRCGVPPPTPALCCELETFTMSWDVLWQSRSAMSRACWPIKGLLTTVGHFLSCSDYNPLILCYVWRKIVLSLLQWRCRLLEENWSLLEIPLLFFVTFSYLLVAVTGPQGICEAPRGNIWVSSCVIIPKAGFKTLLQSSALDKSLLWFLCTKDHSNVGLWVICCLFADRTVSMCL